LLAERASVLFEAAIEFEGFDAMIDGAGTTPA
jgi:hypothetical protein